MLMTVAYGEEHPPMLAGMFLLQLWDALIRCGRVSSWQSMQGLMVGGFTSAWPRSPAATHRSTVL